MTKENGHRPPNQGYGPFEAFSVKPDGSYLRTFHRSIKLARRRLQGNPRHSRQKIVDHRPSDSVTGERLWVWLDESGRAMQPQKKEV